LERRKTMERVKELSVLFWGGSALGVELKLLHGEDSNGQFCFVLSPP
jgi:hypothetical protein